MEKEKYLKSILFVEDELSVRDEMESILSHYCENLYLATDGVDGFEYYKKYHPDLIITDLNMPNMNGIDMLKKIREIDKNTKAIALTAKSELDYILPATSLGLIKYILKPLDFMELDKAIKDAASELNQFTIISKHKIQLLDDYIWDIDNNELYCNEKIVNLTPKEKRIFNYMVQHPNSTISYETLIYEAWDNYESLATKETLKVFINTLRKKLPKDTLENVYGIGYKLKL